jgi:hypothetical protein
MAAPAPDSLEDARDLSGRRNPYPGRREGQRPIWQERAKVKVQGQALIFPPFHLVNQS